MAENKKSVVLYCDIIHTVKELSDEEAGKLFKHYLEYVNDLNPTSPDKLTQIAFEPIKQSLKRDLKKWEETKVKKSESGYLGGIKSGESRRKQKEANEANASKSKQNEANEAVSVSVSDSVIINKAKKISFKDSEIFDKNNFKNNFENWSVEKLKYYWDAADRYSTEGNKYIDWKKAIQGWAAKDEKDGKGFKNRPSLHNNQPVN